MKSRPVIKPNKLCNKKMLLWWPANLGDSVPAELIGTRRDEPKPFVHCNGMTG